MSRYSETSSLIKKMNEITKAKMLKENAEILKEEDFKYPNMDVDVKQDITDTKEALKSYLIKIDDSKSHKFLNNGGAKNVIFYFSCTIKNLPFVISYSLDDEGCIIYTSKSENSFPLYNELISFFNDVKNYYMIWKKNWTEKLNDL
jgi:hypothetical protein